MLAHKTTAATKKKTLKFNIAKKKKIKKLG
jgi:hypothetical protein